MAIPRRLVLAVTAWPEGTHSDPDTGTGTCIEVSRLLVDTLRRLGISEAKAVAVDVVFGNAAAKGLQGVPMDEWPPDAHTCGAGVGYQMLAAGSTTEPGRRKGFVGHVVVVGDDWMVDMTAQQFHRPDRGIIIEGPVCTGSVPGIGSKHHHELELALPEGGWCLYVTRPEVKSYRTSNAWRSEVGLADTIDVLVAAVLQREATLGTVAG